MAKVPRSSMILCIYFSYFSAVIMFLYISSSFLDNSFPNMYIIDIIPTVKIVPNPGDCLLTSSVTGTVFTTTGIVTTGVISVATGVIIVTTGVFTGVAPGDFPIYLSAITESVL